MLRLRAIFGVVGLAVLCFLTAGSAQADGPSLKFTDNTPAGVGNPPVAGLVYVKVQWANVTGADKVVFEFFRVTMNGDARVQTRVLQQGNTPIQAAGTASQSSNGDVASGQTGCVKVTIYDANGNELVSIQSADYVVP
jgi:hypothetical protein